MIAKAYFYFLLVFHLAVYVPSLRGRLASLHGRADMLFVVVNLSGVCAYAYGRRLGHPHFWKGWLFFILSWDLYFNVVRPEHLYPVHWALIAIAFAILTPEYFAFYSLGFRGPG